MLLVYALELLIVCLLCHEAALLPNGPAHPMPRQGLGHAFVRG